MGNLSAGKPAIALPPCNGIEEQFILRLPPSLSSILTSELVENEYTSPGELSIKFITGRTAIVKHPRFIKEAYPAVLMDSPTVMETLKSSNLIINEINVKEADDDEIEGENEANKKETFVQEVNVGQYYKVADLNQILMVLDLDTVEGQRVFNRIPASLQEQLIKSLQSTNLNNNTVNLDDVTATWAQWPDGLTLPMKSAKQKRFCARPLHASGVGELERIEREVERLLKSDGQAIESKFSLISSDGQLLLGDSGREYADIIEGREDEDHLVTEGEYSTSSSSSASDIEDMNDFAAEIEDNLLVESQANIDTDVEMDTKRTISEPTNIQETEPTANTPASIPLSSTDILVKDLEAKLAEKLKQAESVTNPLIKARIEDVIRQLEDNLKNLRERE